MQFGYIGHEIWMNPFKGRQYRCLTSLINLDSTVATQKDKKKQFIDKATLISNNIAY